MPEGLQQHLPSQLAMEPSQPNVFMPLDATVTQLSNHPLPLSCLYLLPLLFAAQCSLFFLHHKRKGGEKESESVRTLHPAPISTRFIRLFLNPLPNLPSHPPLLPWSDTLPGCDAGARYKEESSAVPFRSERSDRCIRRPPDNQDSNPAHSYDPAAPATWINSQVTAVCCPLPPNPLTPPPPVHPHPEQQHQLQQHQHQLILRPLRPPPRLQLSVCVPRAWGLPCSSRLGC
ncbi:unnamed protein product [Pleuronectes platessa]|uniref:Uncharacterized protein n=1 Tax=Pleuronectes platessa TaxID=8262 RepID=A0A9N7TJW3_PLEPL|nr:unnamed protein product [Pleuronectes platessa]